MPAHGFVPTDAPQGTPCCLLGTPCCLQGTGPSSKVFPCKSA